MNDILAGIFDWIKHDYRTHPARFIVEVLAWAASIFCSVVVALTVPNPPFAYLYPAWISGCAMYAWAAWTRKSFGMLANYLLLTTIDTIGFTRMLLQ